MIMMHVYWAVVDFLLMKIAPSFSGYVDHSARVMRVITWNKSLRGIANGEGAKDDHELDEHETHATVLDKLLAWEKKLYDEVKVN